MLPHENRNVPFQPKTEPLLLNLGLFALGRKGGDFSDQCDREKEGDDYSPHGVSLPSFAEQLLNVIDLFIQ
jgi:hypothetical protein